MLLEGTNAVIRAGGGAEAARSDDPEGARASVAAIAARAGVGIGSLHRRFRTKEELFQHLCAVALDGWIRAAEEGLAHDDPWEGLAHYVTAHVESRAGSLGPVAGTIAVTEEMAAKHERSDELTGALVARAREARVLRSDVTALDITALIVQFSMRDHVEFTEAELDSRRRIVAIVLDGLRAPQKEPLPGRPPGGAGGRVKLTDPPGHGLLREAALSGVLALGGGHLLEHTRRSAEEA